MSKIETIKTIETRSFAVELLAAGEADSRTVAGYAALTESVTDMGWYNEVIAAGAFDDADISDVRALFNHDPSKLLARTPGTLKLTIDERGLFYSFEAPNTTSGNDLIESLRRGDITQSSFAFRVLEQEWIEKKGEKELRRITKIELVQDVSPVTYPAYKNTDVALRCKQEYTQKNKLATEKRAEYSDFKVAVQFLNQQR